ncbi:lipopolysaccharide biosynthesis protein [Alkalicoccus halolimnae]|uniref:Lipopolysaccharide biosynthesis protein n=1 Tax=Alkalicoccus halolimnae TaxID=1667239 RepID=A0A5C7F629_9BACI|nr:lipopolysaccharide biosynthesis protein [Alkalicoccus halolimnae]TXF85463.1 lipopolysaccharide biosynthesis protein [Alkalicoccus halolimnae]
MINNRGSLRKQTMNGLIWMMSGSGIQSILQFVVLIVLARLLDPESFGVISAALVIITFVLILSSLGFGPALVQKKEISDKEIGTSYTVSLVLSLLFGAGVYFTAPYTAAFFDMNELIPVLQVLAFSLLFNSVGVVAESLIQRELKFNLIVRIQILSYLSYGIIGVVLAVMGAGVWALTFAYFSQIFVKSILSLVLQPYQFRFLFDFTSLKNLFHFSLGYSLAKISAELSMQGDNLVVGRFLGAEALGFYSRAYQLMVMPANLIGQVLEKVLFPAMSKIQDNHAKLAQVYREGMRITTIFILPSSIFLIMNAEKVILLLFGENWLGLTEPFKVLAFVLLFRSAYKISDALVKAKGAVYKRAIIKAVYGGLVLLGAWAGHFYGLTGVAVGVSVAIVINYAVMMYLVASLINCSIPSILKAHGSGIILSVVTYLLLFLIERLYLLTDIHEYLELVISGVLWGGAILLLLFLFSKFFIGIEQRKILQLVKLS